MTPDESRAALIRAIGEFLAVDQRCADDRKAQDTAALDAMIDAANEYGLALHGHGVDS